MRARAILTIIATFAAMGAAMSGAAGFEGADLERLRRTGLCPACDLRGADLSGTSLARTNLIESSLGPLDLSGADLSHAILRAAPLHKSGKPSVLKSATARQIGSAPVLNTTGSLKLPSPLPRK